MASRLRPLTQPGLARRYWALAEKHQLFDWNALATGPACPFRRHGYQLMRNQLMAAVLEADTRDHRPARVDFVALVHDENPRIRTLAQPMGGTTELVEGWRSVLTDPSFSLVEGVGMGGCAASTPALADWVAQMREQFFLMLACAGLTNGSPCSGRPVMISDALQSSSSSASMYTCTDVAPSQSRCLEQVERAGAGLFQVVGGAAKEVRSTSAPPE